MTRPAHGLGRARLRTVASLALLALLSLTLLPASAGARSGFVRGARPVALIAASVHARIADRRLVYDAHALAKCRRASSRCTTAQRALQRAGDAFTAAERHLAGVAYATARKRRAAHPRRERLRQAPHLALSGQGLSWTRIVGARGYVLARRVPGQAVQDAIVSGTSTTPPAVPGETVTYSVRTTAIKSSWSDEVSITYPAPSAPEKVETQDPQSAPALAVSGGTLSWAAVAGITTYVLDTKAPGHADEYTEVSGTSFTPPADAGATVHYAIRTAVEGSSWSTEVSIAFPAAPAPEPPVEHSSHGSGSMEIGLDTGGWTGSLLSELLAGGIGTFRVHSSAALAVGAQAPGHIGSIVFGEGGSIGSINPTTYAAEVLSVSAAVHPHAIEVLNEPGNPGFWHDTTNYAAYARLAKATHEALALLPASSRPVELCSWDGGEGPNSTWGAGIEAAGALEWCDGVTAHAYGGSSGQDGGALGGRHDVETAHANSGLPVYVTEIGWPTAVGQPSTGDSQQWTEAQQAENMTNFANWARGTGYVNMVIFFNAVDYGSNTSYGVETASRKHKLSFATLGSLAS